MIPFVGRKQELQTLNNYLARPGADLVIMYGRRRVGKTSLLTHWLRESDVQHSLYWVAQPTSATDQLRQFSQAIYRFANPDSAGLEHFSYESWDQALEQVGALADGQKLTLIIDEFTYLLGRAPGLAGIFQNGWDHLLKTKNLLLILSGSHLGMMKKHVLAYQSPLYGRASGQIHLQPLPFSNTAPYFPSYDAAERVAIYAIFGGVPAYWERINQAVSISENIRQELLTPNNLMQAEPRLLLHDFVREPDNYIGIFNAIANGYRTQKEMITFTGLAQGHISSYIALLENAGFIERRLPATAGPRSRQSRYHITDPYLRFYHRFLATRQSQLAMNVAEPALAEIQRHLLDFIGTHTWEEIGREWILKAGAQGILPFLPNQVGSYWDKKVQVDIVGINSMEKTLILGECKWSPKVMGTDVLHTLIHKTAAVVPKQGQWQVFFVGVARGGWSREAHEAVTDFEPCHGTNWTAVGAKLVNLQQVDQELQTFSS